MTNSPDKFPPAPTQDQSLRQAVVHHKAGRLQDAERLYRAILQAQPQHPDANHNLGVLAVQVKKPAAGLPYFKAALEANPNQGQYWLSYIDALIQTGQMDVARKVLVQGRQRGLQGNAVDALAGRLEGPSSDEIKTLMDLFNQGRYTEGEALSRGLTECFPQVGFAWKVLGAMLKLQGRSAEALEPLQKAAELLPRDAEAHNNLGVTLKELGRLTESEVSYRRALELKPDSAEAHNNLGVTLQALGRLTESEASYRRALEIKPDYAEAHNNLGVTLKELGRLTESEVSFRRSLEIKPNYAEAHNNLGVTLKELGRLTESEVSFRRSLEIRPDYAEAHNNRGVILKELDQRKAAFDMAAGTAEEGKKIATAEANAAVAGLEEDWKNLKTAAKNVEKKMRNKKIKNAWAADAKAFAEGLKATKDKIVTDPAGTKANVGELKSVIEKWDAVFKWFWTRS
jgi:tetratricopeptide (TPR) repeat protein